jgi:hypothetical protein
MKSALAKLAALAGAVVLIIKLRHRDRRKAAQQLPAKQPKKAA